MAHETLKTAVAVLIRALGGPEAAASCTRVVPSNLSEYQARHHPKRHASIDVVADMEAIAGEPIVTSALAQAQGYRLVPVTARGEGEVAEALARVGQRSGQVFAVAASALADGLIDARERAELLRELAELERVTGEAAALLAPDRIMRGAGGAAA